MKTSSLPIAVVLSLQLAVLGWAKTSGAQDATSHPPGLTGRALLQEDPLSPGTYDVTFRVETDELIGALQLEVDYSAAKVFGDFDGSGASVDCEQKTGIGAGLFAANDDEARQVLNLAYVSLAGFSGPTDFVTCKFTSTQPGLAADGSDFGTDGNITVIDASDPDLNPIDVTVITSLFSACTTALPAGTWPVQLVIDSQGVVLDTLVWTVDLSGTEASGSLINCEVDPALQGAALDRFDHQSADLVTFTLTGRFGGRLRVAECDFDATTRGLRSSGRGFALSGVETAPSVLLERGKGIDIAAIEGCGDCDVTGTEVCDDGGRNDTSESLCVSSCSRVQTCGDRIVDGTEQCDRGGTDTRNCDRDCTFVTCGDGLSNNPAGEECDDGNAIDGDGCDSNCTITACGNNVVTAGEACDTGGDSITCDDDCTTVKCGDGNFNEAAGEQCDDGSQCADGTDCTTDETACSEIDDGTCGPRDGGGCDSDCTLTGCGNGIVTPPEFCDDGGESATCDDNCSPVECGDGNTNETAGEACDDGNTSSNDTCPASCQDATCGDGFVCTSSGCRTGPGGGVEECDDGDGNSDTLPDACRSRCANPDCGDGVTDSGEQCDDFVESRTCDDDCTEIECGDGNLNGTGGEECEDGNLFEGDGCDSQCFLEVCGNGRPQAGNGEECDDGNHNDGDGCNKDCMLERCGDTNLDLDLGEECDDGNRNDDDGCDSNCTVTRCQNGIQTTGEDCDDGNNRNDDACVFPCRDASCGDGMLWRGMEECDDGSQCDDGTDCTRDPDVCDGIGAGTCSPRDGGGCDANCMLIVPLQCGDGVVDEGEECDDGNHGNWDECTNHCRIAACGDGFRCTSPGCHSGPDGGPEECDDSNAVSGDGCTANCELECGNSARDGACAEGRTFGAACRTDADCDSAPGASDGRCILGETCDLGDSGMCSAEGVGCSNHCHEPACGNGMVECEEECDLGERNGAPGGGCTQDCARGEVGIIGKTEHRRPWECLSGWTLDAPVGDMVKKHRVCIDGTPCDADQIAGRCTFRTGVCLNRTRAGDTRDNCPPPRTIKSFDLRRMKISTQAAMTESIIAAVASLSSGKRNPPDPSGTVILPGRCRRGARRKPACSENYECDSKFGSGNGICDAGTGVIFADGLTAEGSGRNQAQRCTPGIDVVVAAGASLKLRSFVRAETGRPDRDSIRLTCVPAE